MRLFWTAVAINVCVLIICSCDKRVNVDPCASCINPPDPINNSNKLPVADAGVNRWILPSQDTVTADGRKSFDPDGSIVSYRWKKLTGANATIVDSSQVKTLIKDLQPGLYTFQLQVTDNKGAQAKDTFFVSVAPVTIENPCFPGRPRVQARLTAIADLTEVRSGIGVGVVGDKIICAGGSLMNGTFSKKVEFFNTITHAITTAELSKGRSMIGIATLGNKVFFGGGSTNTPPHTSNAVDIYDDALGTWTIASLSLPDVGVSAIGIGNKIYFTGGYSGSRGKRIDIYDVQTNSWSISELPENIRAFSAVAAGTKIYYAGGIKEDNTVSGKIQTYDVSTGSWSASALQTPRFSFGALNFNNNIYWISGHTNSAISNLTCSVEVMNSGNGFTSIENLYAGAEFYTPDQSQNAVVQNGRIIILHPGTITNLFDIYDSSSNTWSIGELPYIISEAALVSVNNVIYVINPVVNGTYSNKIYKLEF